MTTHADRLRILPEFQPEEYDEFRDVLFGRLSNRLARWNPDQVSLELGQRPEQEVAANRARVLDHREAEASRNLL